jgi:hypothetical protein
MVALVFVAAAACGGEDFQSGDGGSGGASSASDAGGSSASGEAGSTSSGGMDGTGGTGCPSGSVCMPPVPDGWEGPVGVYIGAEPLDSCPAPWSTKTDVNFGEPHAPHTCTECSCATATNVTCSYPTVSIYISSNCSGTAEAAVTVASSACTFIGGGYSLKSTIATAAGGACAPAGGAAVKTTPSWRSTATVCSGGSTTECASGVCSPVVEAPFHAGLCVQQDGDVDCPDDFVERAVGFKGLVDERACEQCTCSAPSGATCDGKLKVYEEEACASAPDVLNNNGLCHVGFNGAVTFDNSASGGTCTGSGGAPKGGLQNALPVTICCTR